MNSIILQWIFFILITAIFVIFVIERHGEFSFLSLIQLKYLLPIFFLHLLSLILANTHFYLILKALLGVKQIKYIDCLKHFTVGRFLNNIIPYSGGIYRAVAFKQLENISYKKYISCFLSFTWMNILIALFIGIIVIGLFNPTMQIGNITVIPFLLVFFLICLLVIPIFNWLSGLLNSSRPPKTIRKAFSQAVETMQGTLTTMKNKKLLLNSSIIIATTAIVQLGILYFCCLSLNLTPNFPLMALFVIIVKFGGLFRLTPGNLGITEFLFGFLTKATGSTLAVGITISMVSRVSALLILGAVSIISFLRKVPPPVSPNKAPQPVSQ